MATLALFALGSAIGPSLFGSAVVGGLTGAALGGAIGATAGSLIDSQFLFPALFGNGTQNYSGPRLDDFRVQLASEGSPVNYCMGPHNRVSGTVIWSTDLIESSRTQRAGKAADPQAQPHTHIQLVVLLVYVKAQSVLLRRYGQTPKLSWVTPIQQLSAPVPLRSPRRVTRCGLKARAEVHHCGHSRATSMPP